MSIKPAEEQAMDTLNSFQDFDSFLKSLFPGQVDEVKMIEDPLSHGGGAGVASLSKKAALSLKGMTG